MSKKLLTAGLMAALTLASGCATSISQDSKDRPILKPADAATKTSRGEERTPTYLRINKGSAERINDVALSKVPLSFILNEALPAYHVTQMDAGVDLKQPVSIGAHDVTVDQFLASLGSVSGYDLKAIGHNIEVRSVITREWTLAALAGAVKAEAKVEGSSGGSSGGGSGSDSAGASSSGNSGGGNGGSSSGGSTGTRSMNASFAYETDEWEAIVNSAKAILSGQDQGATAPDAAASATAQSSALVAIRSVGVLRATGPVERVKKLDSWLTSVQAKSERQVRLDARFIEVTLNDSKSRGIDWSAMGAHVFGNGVGLNLGLGGGYGVTANGEGSFNINAGVKYGDESLTALINFLATFGNVELRDEPQATTLNGRTVFISSGEEFGYISSIQQTATNGAIAVTPNLARILIGVEMSVTPRILDDGRVLLEIVPVVSNFQGFDKFSVAGNEFSQPRITLKQMATQVITRPGQTVQIGGLISSRLTETLKKLPIGDRKALGLSALFESESNLLERKELLLVVTPYLQES